MTRFLFNLALALLWCALSGNAHPWNFLAGLLVSALVLGLYYRAVGDRPYLGRFWKLVRFSGYFLRILVQTNLQVAWEVLTPKMHQRPRIIRYCVDGMSEMQRLALANAITLTPGTLVVDISPCDKWIYIHCMYAQDARKAEREIDELASKLREGVFA